MTRKPIVLVAGQLQQLQPGDNIGEVDIPTFTNGDSGSHAIGDIVYLSAADTVKKAQANASGTTAACAVATQAVSAAASGAYQTDGVLAGLSGLTAGATYYLSAGTAGAMTTTAPSAAGQFVLVIGQAKSTTELIIRFEQPIQL
jgi:hypothetical protein